MTKLFMGYGSVIEAPDTVTSVYEACEWLGDLSAEVEAIRLHNDNSPITSSICKGCIWGYIVEQADWNADTAKKCHTWTCPQTCTCEDDDYNYNDYLEYCEANK